MELPRLYPIRDAEALARARIPLGRAAQTLRDAGVRWAQYRDKQSSDAEGMERMRELRGIFPQGEAVLLLNDRVHLCEAVQADGVHVGQEDMAPDEARRVPGPDRLRAVPTPNVEQLRAALATGPR